MADTLTAAGQADSKVQSTLIPKGRENDYWELSTPSANFLDMQIDRGNMYVAPLLITNGSEDRDGEVTNPEGLIDAAYKIDPVVFLQHSHRIDPMLPPVGTAETPDRQYDLHRRPDGWYSGCRFTQTHKMAEQTFRLVDDGVLRGRSIGALNHALNPYKPKMPGMAFVNNQIVPVRTKSVSHEKYELIEWSWVWMPANRDIVTMPKQGITPHRDVVPLLKGIISQNKLDGMTLDPRLGMVLKSLNLAEPTSATFHKAKYWPLKSVGELAVETPFEILFSRKSFTQADAKKFLSSSSDLGLIETALVSEGSGGAFLKSVQFAYSGPVQEVENPEVPGMILRFCKALSPAEAVAAEVKPEDKDKDQVDVEAAQQPASQSAGQIAPATQGDATAIVSQEEQAAVKGVKPGLRYLKALIQKATEMADEAEAAMEEQEPELTEKCQQFTHELRAFIGKVAEFQTERYGNETQEEKAEEKPESALIEKSVKADLFYGRKIKLPAPFTKGLHAMHDLATDDKQKTLAAAMLKGCVSTALPERKSESKPSPEDELKERVRRIASRTLVKGLT